MNPPGRHPRLAGLGGLAAALVAMVYAAFWLPTPIAFDEFLALPVARAIANPTLYSPADLLVTSGIRAPFHLYHAASVLYHRGADVDAWWFAGLILSIGALTLAAWCVATALRAPMGARVFAATLVAVSPFYRGTVNWSGEPLLWFVSASVGLPLAIGSLAAALADRPLVAAALAGLAFDVHPGAGVIAGAVSLGIMAFGGGRSGWRPLVRWGAVVALVAAPNVVYVALGSSANFTITGSDRVAFWEIFRSFAHHVYPREHWREGYAWFALELAAIGVALCEHGSWPRRRVIVAIGVVAGLIGGYAAVIAAQATPAIALMFLARASWFVKPVAFALVTAALHQAWQRREDRALVALAGICCIGAVLHRNVGVGEGLLALGLAAWQASRRTRIAGLQAALLAVLGVALAWASRGGAGPTAFRDALRLITIMTGLAVGLHAVLTQPALPAALPAPRSAWLGGAWWAVVPAAIAIATGARTVRQLAPRSFGAIESAVHFSKPAPAIAGLVRWASGSTEPGSMFLVPPDDQRLVPFRLQAGRSTYIQTADIGQLSYDLRVYRIGFQRLLAIGTRVIAPHTVDVSGYSALTAAQLQVIARDGPRYAVFETGTRLVPLSLPVAWRDGRWVVYRIGGAPPGRMGTP